MPTDCRGEAGPVRAGSAYPGDLEAVEGRGAAARSDRERSAVAFGHESTKVEIDVGVVARPRRNDLRRAAFDGDEDAAPLEPVHDGDLGARVALGDDAAQELGDGAREKRAVEARGDVGLGAGRERDAPRFGGRSHLAHRGREDRREAETRSLDRETVPTQ